MLARRIKGRDVSEGTTFPYPVMIPRLLCLTLLAFAAFFFPLCAKLVNKQDMLLRTVREGMTIARRPVR